MLLTWVTTIFLKKKIKKKSLDNPSEVATKHLLTLSFTTYYASLFCNQKTTNKIPTLDIASKLQNACRTLHWNVKQGFQVQSTFQV
jgi:hypothetical protein